MARVNELLKLIDDAISGRDIATADVSTEAAQIDAFVKAAIEWMEEAWAVANQAVDEELPGAVELQGRLGDRPDGSYREVRPMLIQMRDALLAAGDLVALGFTEGFAEVADKLVHSLDDNRAEQADANAGVTVSADTIHAAVKELARWMEKVELARTVAEKRLKRALPGFDLRLIRAAAASPSPGGTVEVPDAPEAGTPAPNGL